MKFSREEIEEIEDWVKGTTLPKVVQHLIDLKVEVWKNTREEKNREDCWQMIQCLRMVEAAIHSIAADQKIDQFNAGRARANNWTFKPQTEDSQ